MMENDNKQLRIRVNNIIIGFGIYNLFLIIICVIYRVINNYKYIYITSTNSFFLLILLSILPLIILTVVLYFKKNKYIILKSNILSFLIVVATLIIMFAYVFYYSFIGFLFTGCTISKTTNIKDYFVFDEMVNEVVISGNKELLSTYLKNVNFEVFPRNIPQDDGDVDYGYYFIKTLSGEDILSLDIYLKLSNLSDEKYNYEKERITELMQKVGIKDSLYISKDEDEFFKKYNDNNILCFYKYIYDYYFVSFIEDSNTIIYNFSLVRHHRPYFISNMKNEIKCDI